MTNWGYRKSALRWFFTLDLSALSATVNAFCLKNLSWLWNKIMISSFVSQNFRLGAVSDGVDRKESAWESFLKPLIATELQNFVDIMDISVKKQDWGKEFGRTCSFAKSCKLAWKDHQYLFCRSKLSTLFYLSNVLKLSQFMCMIVFRKIWFWKICPV